MLSVQNNNQDRHCSAVLTSGDKGKVTLMQRRISKRRKEKSRDAARCRRSEESEIFSELASVLPFPQSDVGHLNKLSIMRLITTNLRLTNVFKSIDLKDEEEETKKYDTFYLKATGGFILVLSLEGDIIFVSQNVSHYLGIAQVDALGQNIIDLFHPCDQSEISDIFAGKLGKNKQCSFFMRMKCWSAKGRGINTKSSSYKVLHIVGKLIKMGESSSDGHSFIAIATPIPYPIDTETPLGKFTFLSKHSLDMKFTFADERMTEFLGYNPENLLGKSMYDFHHAQDNKTIEKAFRGLFSKGQSDTGQYRFLAQGGGYVWVSTQATVIYCEKSSKPQSVVCVNYIVSARCDEKNIYSSDQLEYVNKKRPVSTTNNLFVIKSEFSSTKPQLASVKDESTQNLEPRPGIIKMFAPLSAEMTSEFFKSFDDDDPYSTNETDDLTCLAPTFGDSCAPLGSPHLKDLIDEILSTNDEMTYPLIDGREDISLFSAFRDECTDSCHSPSLTLRPGSSGPLSSFCVESPPFDDAIAMKSFLGFDSDDEDMSFNQFEDILGDETLLLFPDIQWDFAVNNENSSQGARCDEKNIHSSDQLEYVNKKQQDSTTNNLFVIKSESTQNLEPRPGIIKMFAPLSAEMTSEFFKSFDDDDPYSTNETDDLTSLAPTSGDSCAPLGSPHLKDLIDEILSTNDEMTYPLIDGRKDISLFSAFRDECTDSCHSPSLTPSPGSSGPLSSFCVESPPFDDAIAMKSFLGFDSDDEDMSFNQFEDILGDETLLLFPDIQWDFAVNNENSSQGERCDEKNIHSSDQLEYVNKKQQDSTTNNLFVIKSESTQNLEPRPGIIKMFAPLSAEMTSEFFKSFDDDDPYSTNETDDLTSLAPTSGDSCAPLGSPHLKDLIDEILSTNDEMTYPLIDGRKDISLFSAFRDECTDSCQSPSLTLRPGSSGPLSSFCVKSPPFDDAIAMKSFLGFDSDDEDMSFNQFEDILGDETLLLFPDIQWDFAVNNENSSQGTPSPMDMKTQDDIAGFEQLLQSRDLLKNTPEQVHSSIKFPVDPDNRNRGSPLGQEGMKKRNHQNVQDPGGGSVLMNLLVAGCDRNAGYDTSICVQDCKLNEDFVHSPQWLGYKFSRTIMTILILCGGWIYPLANPKPINLVER